MKSTQKMTEIDAFDETALLRAIEKGDTVAYQQIYLRYYDPLLKHSTLITKSISVSEDILQNIFLKFWETRTNFQNFDKIRGWLFVSVYNASINQLKKAYNEISKDDALDALIDDEDHAAIEKLESQYKLIEDAIKSLPEQRKKVFLLCKYEGLSYEQAAERLSVSKNTVKDHMTRATSAIRNFVSKDPDKAMVVSTITLLNNFL